MPELIPVRMLNEFTYCPRLGYLEWVDGEWEENFETLNGSFGHRRVDKPSTKAVAKPESGTSDSAADAVRKLGRDGREHTQDKLHTRSLLLSAPRERLVAKLDLLEIEGRVATPVDYKRGKAPDVPEGAWEPERVQLCAQGLILRENGFQCDEGVLYFIGSKKRVAIVFDDELVARTRELVAKFREAATRTEAPPPLVDSRKCPRCSLVGICMPDEVNLLRADVVDEGTSPRSLQNQSGLVASSTTKSVPSKPRKLLPARNNALPFYVQEQGAMISKSADRLVVKKKGEVIGERRLMDVSQVSVFGSVMLTAAALRELNVRGVPVCHFSYGGWFHGITTGLVHKNVELRIRQYSIAGDADQSLEIAKRFIAGKIRNSRTLLRRHLDKSEKPLLTKLADYCRRVEQTESAESLLGLEGMAAKVYFSGLFKLMGERHDFDVNDRNRRPPKDPVNAVLSFAYALLTKELTVVLQAVGFDPMLGVFHRPRYGRPSLALDLAEEYRPLIADSVMLTAFNNGELTSSDFLERAGAVTLTKSGRAALIATFERRMQTEVTHPIFKYRISYRRLLEVQARLLSRAMLGEIAEYPAFCTR
jgi:CRISPR-associated protein Cas1